jgi:SAM-dependent methyltransferase
MSMNGPSEQARRRASEALAAGDPTAWFEPLYAAAAVGDAVVPWARGEPNAEIAAWAEGRTGEGKRAVVIGSALGDDAEFVASLGYDTVAFDVSASAVAAVRGLFPGSTVDYVVADLLALPTEWLQGFDVVVEISTVQALPRDLRPAAVEAVTGLLAPDGTLLVGAFAAEQPEFDGPPWPLTRQDVESFATTGVRLLTLERTRAGHRWWATFSRD